MTAALHAEKSCACDIGALVFQIRSERGMTQVELAREIRVHRSSVLNWEKGKFSPRSRHLRSLRELVRRVPVAAR